MGASQSNTDLKNTPEFHDAVDAAVEIRVAEIEKDKLQTAVPVGNILANSNIATPLANAVGLDGDGGQIQITDAVQFNDKEVVKEIRVSKECPPCPCAELNISEKQTDALKVIQNINFKLPLTFILIRMFIIFMDSIVLNEAAEYGEFHGSITDTKNAATKKINDATKRISGLFSKTQEDSKEGRRGGNKKTKRKCGGKLEEKSVTTTTDPDATPADPAKKTRWESMKDPEFLKQKGSLKPVPIYSEELETYIQTIDKYFKTMIKSLNDLFDTNTFDEFSNFEVAISKSPTTNGVKDTQQGDDKPGSFDANAFETNLSTNVNNMFDVLDEALKPPDVVATPVEEYSLKTNPEDKDSFTANPDVLNQTGKMKGQSGGNKDENTVSGEQTEEDDVVDLDGINLGLDENSAEYTKPTLDGELKETKTQPEDKPIESTGKDPSAIPIEENGKTEETRNAEAVVSDLADVPIEPTADSKFADLIKAEFGDSEQNKKSSYKIKINDSTDEKIKLAQDIFTKYNSEISRLLYILLIFRTVLKEANNKLTKIKDEEKTLTSSQQRQMRKNMALGSIMEAKSKMYVESGFEGTVKGAKDVGKGALKGLKAVGSFLRDTPENMGKAYESARSGLSNLKARFSKKKGGKRKLIRNRKTKRRGGGKILSRIIEKTGEVGIAVYKNLGETASKAKNAVVTAAREKASKAAKTLTRYGYNLANMSNFMLSTDTNIKQKYMFMMFFTNFLRIYYDNVLANEKYNKSSTIIDTDTSADNRTIKKGIITYASRVFHSSLSLVYRNKGIGLLCLSSTALCNALFYASPFFPPLVLPALISSVGNKIILVGSAPFLDPPKLEITRIEQIVNLTMSMKKSDLVSSNMEKSNTTFTKDIFVLFTTRIPGLEFEESAPKQPPEQLSEEPDTQPSEQSKPVNETQTEEAVKQKI